MLNDRQAHQQKVDQARTKMGALYLCHPDNHVKRKVPTAQIPNFLKRPTNGNQTDK